MRRKQTIEPAERTAQALTRLKQDYNIDSVQFYDNNFFLNESLTFRSCHAGEHEIGSRESEVGSRGLLSRFLHYEKACVLGALLNALVTVALTKSGIRLLTAAAAGVVAGGAWNFLFNIPNIWRVWGAPTPVSRSISKCSAS